MLKVIGSEIQANYYMVHRLMLLFTRTKGIPKVEPSGIQITSQRHDQRRFLRNDVDSYQEAAEILNFINLKKSKGNYIVDADGNTLLDLCGTELNPLGYNHEAFVKALHAKEFDSALINSNLTSNEVSTAEFQALVKKVMRPLAPERLGAVTFTRGGQGVEKAILTAMAERGHGAWTALGFQGSTHGNHTSFALAQFRGVPKLPSLNWPVHPYPVAANEASILDDVHTSLKTQRNSGKPVAALVIEPLQSTTGHVASERFLKELRSVTRDNEAALIVDTTETAAGATGKSFWGYPGVADPDYLVFGKRTQVEGFFSSEESKHASVSLGGDHLRLLQFATIQEAMVKERLIDRVELTGASLRKQVENTIAKKANITGVRGLGTSLFIDTQDGETAFKLQQHLLKEGVVVKANGSRGIAIKPALIMEQKHVDQFTAAISKF